MLHLTRCAGWLFRDDRDSVSLSAKTVSHCRRFGVVFGQKVTHECALWRIAPRVKPLPARRISGQFRGSPFALAKPAGHGDDEASFGIAR